MCEEYIFPKWLKNIIENEDGYYYPDFKKAQYNLTNTHKDNLIYLYTYFPRTVLEIQSIYHLLKDKSGFFEAIHYKKSLKILSIGCGTGGDVIGLILLLKNAFKGVNFDIHLVDGNKDALNLCSELLEALSFNENISIDKNIYIQEIKDINDLQMVSQCFADEDDNFDFIITSKFLNELLKIINNPYGVFVSTFKSCLAKDGIMILLDTTNLVTNTFNPILLNLGVNKAIEEDPAIACLLPIPCRITQNCKKICFTCFESVIKKKYTFKVICHKDFLNKIINNNCFTKEDFAIVGSTSKPNNYRLCPNFLYK